MGNTVMLSGVYEVNHIHKKTSAKMFRDLQVSDLIKISIELKAVGVSRGRSYAKGITFKNLQTGESVTKTFNEIEKILDCFELEDTEND